MLSVIVHLLAAPAAAESPQVTASTPPEVVNGALVLGSSEGPIRIVPVYHSTARIELGGKEIWLDPWSKANLQDAPKADVVLITDVHPDHLDPAALAKVATPDTIYVAPPAVQEALPGLTIQHVLSNGEEVQLGDLTVRAVPMYNIVHGPQPGAVYHPKGRGNGYVLDYGERQVYFAGDTECTEEVKALTGIEVAFLPMNLPYTMSVDEAAACANAFRPHVVVPYHYAGSDIDTFAKEVTAPGVQVILLNFYPGGPPW